jgi:hypothetical protein
MYPEGIDQRAVDVMQAEQSGDDQKHGIFIGCSGEDEVQKQDQRRSFHQNPSYPVGNGYSPFCSGMPSIGRGDKKQNQENDTGQRNPDQHKVIKKTFFHHK